MIPQKINVGFQERKGTYAGKLAYIIYWDHTGKLRKETSWQSWRTTSIETVVADNVPTEGFVLNKKAGGYCSHWNTRATYTRVYDPRGFEFEITIDNLLYILENVTCSKGKGLEGKFVYGWAGTELVLLPVDSPDYDEHKAFSGKLFNNTFIGARELKVGAIYTHVDRNSYLYLGRGNAYENCGYSCDDKQKGKSKHFWFKRLTPNKYDNKSTNFIEHFTSINKKLTECTGEDMDTLVEATEQLSNDLRYKKPGDKIITPITEEQLFKAISESEEHRDGKYVHTIDEEESRTTLYLKDGEYEYYDRRSNSYFNQSYGWRNVTLQDFIATYEPVWIKYLNEDGTTRRIKGKI